MKAPMRNGVFLRRRRLLTACAAALLGGGAPLALPASADPSPIKIAVFDFELDDLSGGAGIAGDNAADLEQLDRATSEVRRLIATPAPSFSRGKAIFASARIIPGIAVLPR